MDSIEEILVKAEKGNAEAQYQLGLFFCRRNLKDTAISWLEKAACQEHKKAREALKEIYKFMNF